MIYLIDIAGKEFGIREEDVAVVKNVPRVHRLPQSHSVMAGIASIEDKSVHLFDLAAWLGYPPAGRGDRGAALFPAGQGDDYAFLLEDGLKGEPREAESTHPLPTHLMTAGIRECAIISGKPVPLISLPDLHGQLLKGVLDPGIKEFPEMPNPESFPSGLEEKEITILEIAGAAFAIPCESVGERTFPLAGLAELPRTPSHVSGITWVGETLWTVLDPSIQLGTGAGKNPEQVLPLSEGPFAILIERVRGRLLPLEFSVSLTPAPFRSCLLQCVITVKDALIPVLEPRALTAKGGSDFADVIFDTASGFRDQFRNERVMLHIVQVNGERYGIPSSLVEDVLDLPPIRELPGSRPVAIGVAAAGGSVLSVIDLERCFGRRSRVDSRWSMVHLKDGAFEGLLLAESVLVDVSVPEERQLDLPPELRVPYLSGCFLEGEDLRLILDVPFLVSHITGKAGEENVLSMVGKASQEEPAPPGKAEAQADLFSRKKPERAEKTGPPPPSDSEEGFDEAAPDSGEDEGARLTEPSAGTLPHGETVSEPLKETGGKEPAPGKGPGETTERGVPHPGPSGEDAVKPHGPEISGEESLEKEKPDEQGSGPKGGMEGEERALFDGDEEEPGKVMAPTWSAPENDMGQGESETGGPSSKAGEKSKSLILVAAILFIGAAGLFSFRDIHSWFTDARIPEHEALAEKEEAGTILSGTSLPQGGKKEEKREAASGTMGMESPGDEKLPDLVMSLTPGEGTILVKKGENGLAGEGPPGSKIHIVREGDTLWDIARTYTGDPFRYPALAEDSDIEDPDLIFPGQRIFIVLGRED